MQQFTPIPNDILDRMSELSPAEFKVIMAIYRLIAGYKDERKAGRRRISIGQLEKMTNLSRQGVVNTFDKIQELGFATKITDGRVTIWDINPYLRVVNSVDYKKEDEVNTVDQSDDEIVNSVDPVVKPVDQGSQMSRPPSYKENSKENEVKESKSDPPPVHTSTNAAAFQDLLAELEAALATVCKMNLAYPKHKGKVEPIAVNLAHLGVSPGNIRDGFGVGGWWYLFGHGARDGKQPYLGNVESDIVRAQEWIKAGKPVPTVNGNGRHPPTANPPTNQGLKEISPGSGRY